MVFGMSAWATSGRHANPRGCVLGAPPQWLGAGCSASHGCVLGAPPPMAACCVLRPHGCVLRAPPPMVACWVLRPPWLGAACSAPHGWVLGAPPPMAAFWVLLDHGRTTYRPTGSAEASILGASMRAYELWRRGLRFHGGSEPATRVAARELGSAVTAGAVVWSSVILRIRR